MKLKILKILKNPNQNVQPIETSSFLPETSSHLYIPIKNIISIKIKRMSELEVILWEKTRIDPFTHPTKSKIKLDLGCWNNKRD